VDKEITHDDVTSAIDNAKAIRISSDREILDTVSQDSSLDGQRGVHNPVGMEGSYLEVFVHVVTSSVTHLNNIYKAITKAGFKVIEPIYGLLATGDVSVTEEEKALGCLLIDFGGQTTGVAIYAEDSIKFSKELPFGSDLITTDISHALRTSVIQAKLIKEKHGVAMPSLLTEDMEIEFMGVDGRTLRKVNRRYLAEIISPRLEEIFNKINDEVQNSPYADVVVPGGIILTGGGASLEGSTTAIEKVLGISTRIGLPQGITGPNKIITDPNYATAIGLLKYRPTIDIIHPKRERIIMNVFKKIRDWL
jgi:cell division protein FtsA